MLDHFGLDDVALMGFSLGGGLVMHAAAHEPRVRRVIAQDILSDFTECYARPLGAPRSTFVQHATRLPDRLVNAVIAAARHRPRPGLGFVLEAAMQAGMPGGSASGAEPFGSPWSGQVTQRRGAEMSGLWVLLRALGQGDHIHPPSLAMAGP